MSTLKVNTIQDASGGNSSTASEISQGRAKVWVNFRQHTSMVIRDSFNVSSVTDVTSGESIVNFQNAFQNNDYSCVVSGSQGLDSIANFDVVNPHSFTTTSVDLESFGSATNPNVEGDFQIVCVAIFGD